MSSTKNIREILFKQMKDLQSGSICIREARETNRTAKQINNSLRLDIENKRENIKLMKALNKKKYSELDAKPLKLF